MKIICFDLWGDYGHFRVPYTTSSPLTFPIPPKTALYGIIGAILGYEKDSYLEKFQDERWKFAIELRTSVKKTYIPENFVNTKEVKIFARMPKGKSCRTQINLEFLKNPYFRIYAYSEGDDFVKLEKFLKEHKSYFSVSLGISECLANFKYIDTYNGNEINMNDNFVEISSIIPISENIEINFFEDMEEKKFIKVRVPLEMKPDRELIEIKDFIVEATGKTIKAKVKNYVKVSEDKNIVLF